MNDTLTPATIPFSDFLRVDIRVGEIIRAEKIEKSDKLMKLEVYLGELGTRTIVAGIAKHWANPVGQRPLVITNLEPRKIFGIESQGMIMACVSPEGGIVSIATCDSVPPGTKVW
jgi:methionyl-tRNA synthetase